MSAVIIMKSKDCLQMCVLEVVHQKKCSLASIVLCACIVCIDFET